MKIPIVALSSNAMDVDTKLAKECGISGHVSKPLGAKELADIVRLVKKK